MNYRSVLVVEDDSDINSLVKEVLETEGYEVQVARNGREAIEVLKKSNQPHLVLLDMNMPVMNGWEFLEERKADEQLSACPVVLVSAVPASSALLPPTGLVAAEGLLSKPMDIDSLLRVVQTYCTPAA